MHAVIRSYSGKGAKELTSVLEKNKGEIEKANWGDQRLHKLFPGSHAGWCVFGLSFHRQRQVLTRASGWRGIGSVKTPALLVPQPRPFPRALSFCI